MPRKRKTRARGRKVSSVEQQNSRIEVTMNEATEPNEIIWQRVEYLGYGIRISVFAGPVSMARKMWEGPPHANPVYHIHIPPEAQMEKVLHYLPFSQSPFYLICFSWKIDLSQNSMYS